jgi:hypothetical protein
MADELPSWEWPQGSVSFADDFIHLTRGTHASPQAFQEKQVFASSSVRVAPLGGASLLPASVWLQAVLHSTNVTQAALKSGLGARCRLQSRGRLGRSP